MGAFFGVAIYHNHMVAMNGNALFNCQVNGTRLGTDVCPARHRPDGHGKWNQDDDMYPNVMMVADPQSGELSLAQSRDSGPRNRDMQATDYETPLTGPTLSTPSITSTISGIVRWDQNGRGDFDNAFSTWVDDEYSHVEAQDSPSMPPSPGRTLALYDGSGRLLAMTTTNDEGRYTFYPSVAVGSNSYVVRLVQPQADGKNAVQSWALTDGVAEDISSPDNPVFTHNSGNLHIRNVSFSEGSLHRE